MRYLRKALILFLEGLMALVAMAALLVALFVGRLMMGPLTTTALTPWVQRALSFPEHNIAAEVTQSMITWDKTRRKIVLDLANVRFLDPLGQKVADVPQVLLVFSPLGYFDASHSPWILVTRHPQLHLRVDQTGQLRLGALQAGESNILERDEETPITAETVSEQLQALAGNLQTPFDLFSNVRIENLGVTLIDEPHNEMWNFRAPVLSMKRQGQDRVGVATLHVTKGKLAAEIDLSLRYADSDKLFHAGLAFKDIDSTLLSARALSFVPADYVKAKLGGVAEAAFDAHLGLRTAELSLKLGPGSLTEPGTFPAPLKITGASLAAHYTGSDNTLTLDSLDVAFEKAALSATGKVQFGDDAQMASGHFRLAGLRLEHLPEFWPPGKAANARDWILANMKKGLAEEVTLDIGISIPGTDFSQTKLDRLKGTVRMKETELRYWEPMPVLTNVSARATFDALHFDIAVEGGEMDAIRLKPSHVVISGLSAEDQYADVTAHIAGPAQDVLRVLDRKPLGYAGKIRIPPASIRSGQVDGILKTKFPLIKALELDKMNLSAEVKLQDLSVARVADLFDISGANVVLGVDTRALSVDGDGRLNGVKSRIRWDEKFSPQPGQPLSRGVASARTPLDSAAKFGVGFPMRSDPMPVTVVYDRYPDLSRLTVSADAKNASLDLPDIYYHKPAGHDADIRAVLEWGGGAPLRLPQIRLSGRNLNVKGTGGFDSSGKNLNRLTLDPFIIGASKARLGYRKENGVSEWTIGGSTLDARGYFRSAGSAAPEKPPPPGPLKLNVRLDHMMTGDAPAAHLDDVRVRGVRDARGWVSLNASATADGAPVRLVLAPEGKETKLRASTPDLGKLLRALDVTDTLTGGKLEMDGRGEPKGDEPRSIFGHITLSDYRVGGMPFLVRLLSAISPDVLGILGNRALRFDDLKSEYIWSRDSFIFTKANTSTGTLGLTAAGRIDLLRSAINLEGQVIPVYFVSRILGAIPVIGDLLTGGEGKGLFAAAYTVKGPLSKPKISVNPVSVLAPGIIRDILFSDPDIAKEDK